MAEAAQSAAAIRRTARLNVTAACVLIVIKLVAGLASNSMGLLAEATHSATDLVAALLTLFAVSVAVRPPDREHHYGHGKAEHLAALGESAFLFLVSLGIGYESIRRVADPGEHAVDARWWTFAVLAIVIALDGFRAINSRRIAARYGSPAIAANTLHFASDLAGTIAVLAGLALVSSGVQRADSVAALFVAVLVIVAAGRLGLRSIDVLMDRTPSDAERAIRDELGKMAGVDLRRLRVRHAAGRNFADLVVAVAPDAGLAQAHATADEIERRIERVVDNADVVVHVEPLTEEGTMRERATAAASRSPDVREIHNVRLLNVDGQRELSLHVKLPRSLSLERAHAIVEELERSVLDEVPEIRLVHTHIEPLARTYAASDSHGPQAAGERATIEAVVTRMTGAGPRRVELRDSDRGRMAMVTLTVAGPATLLEAHQLASRIEQEIKRACEHLVEVVIHTEPR